MKTFREEIEQFTNAASKFKLQIGLHIQILVSYQKSKATHINPIISELLKRSLEGTLIHYCDAIKLFFGAIDSCTTSPNPFKLCSWKKIKINVELTTVGMTDEEALRFKRARAADLKKEEAARRKEAIQRIIPGIRFSEEGQPMIDQTAKAILKNDFEEITKYKFIKKCRDDVSHFYETLQREKSPPKVTLQNLKSLFDIFEKVERFMNNLRHVCGMSDFPFSDHEQCMSDFSNLTMTLSDLLIGKTSVQDE